jgi:hypothetical protein
MSGEELLFLAVTQISTCKSTVYQESPVFCYQFGWGKKKKQVA